jgi:chromosomal replication initiator protein
MEGLSTGVMTVLKGAACIEIGMPDEAMRLEIVRQRVRLLSTNSPNFIVDDEICREIVTRVHGSGRDLCGTVVSLYTETGLGAAVPTMAMLDRVLSRQQKPKPISMDMVKRAVCKTFDMTRGDLEGARKFQRFVRARQVGMYLAREMTDKSFPQIGISFGKRHHTTALYAWRKIAKSAPAKPDLMEDILRARQAISHFQSNANM